MLYSLCTSVTICAVTLILELKMHAKNRNTYMYTRTNFQKHVNRGREDVRVVETSAHKTLAFSLFSSFVETDDKTQKAAPRILNASLSSLQSSFISVRAVGRTLLLSRSFS